jgi:enediyne biosynthesis protein E4
MCAVALTAVVACSKQEEALAVAAPSPTGTHGAGGPPWFEDLGPATGIDFRHQSGFKSPRYLFPEMSGGGVVIFDYDGDGKYDVYCVQSGLLAEEDRKEAAEQKRPPPSSRLYRNLGGWKFEDVTAKAGVGSTSYGMGGTAGDYDSDGDVDLLVTNVGDEILYRNNGDGTFTDVTKDAGCSNPTWSTSAAFCDLDQDGDLDLYVSNYINWARHREINCKGGDNQPDYCGPSNYLAPAIDSLYRNEGNGRFKDVSREAGLETANGNGFGVAIADYNRDGKLDCYVANDGNENQLWINQGGLKFENRALIMGCALGPNGVARAGMGVWNPDVNEDGFYDLFVTNLRNEGSGVFVFDGKEAFDDLAGQLGIEMASRPFTGFGCGFADFDLDGRLDIYVANGAVMRPRGDPPKPSVPYAELNQVFKGLPGPKFVEVFPRGGTKEPLIDVSRPAAFGDLDDDGDVDVIVVNGDGPTYVLNNVAPKAGGFVGLRVVDAKGRVAIGADVVASFGAMKNHRMVMPSCSFNCCNDPRLVIGLGEAKRVDDVSILWADGKKESFGPFEPGKYHDVRQGEGRKDR